MKIIPLLVRSIRFIFAIVVFTLKWLIAFSQTWQPIGSFNARPNCLYSDTSADRLLISGGFTWFDTTVVYGLGVYQNGLLTSQGCGFDIPCHYPLPYSSYIDGSRSLVRFSGDLYTVGNFILSNQDTLNSIAKWLGTDWQRTGSGITFSGGVGNLLGLKAEVIHNELYVYGIFEEINGVKANSVAVFDGTHWDDVFDFPLWDSLSGPNIVYDAEWYNGELYVCGSFQNGLSNPVVNRLVKWDGVNWIPVFFVNPGNTNFGINNLSIYKNKLLIAGMFSSNNNPGNVPGNNIVLWDGLSWDTLGGGVNSSSSSGFDFVKDVLVKGDTIIVGGQFDVAGNENITNVALWDGHKWCGSLSAFDGSVKDVEVYHDSVYILGDFTAIDGVNVSYVAKRALLEFSDLCSTPLAGSFMDMEVPEFALYPNVAPSQITFEISLLHEEPLKWNVMDLGGRCLLVGENGGTKGVNRLVCDVSAFPPGLYLLQLQTPGTAYTRKFLKL